MVGPRFLMPKSREIIDAEDCFVIPGFVDRHVNYGIMSEPSFAENCKHNGKADSIGAAFGGVTIVLPMLQSNESYLSLADELMEWGNEDSAVDYAFICCVP